MGHFECMLYCSIKPSLGLMIAPMLGAEVDVTPDGIEVTLYVRSTLSKKNRLELDLRLRWF